MKVVNMLSIAALFAVLNAGSLQAASETEATSASETTSEAQPTAETYTTNETETTDEAVVAEEADATDETAVTSEADATDEVADDATDEVAVEATEVTDEAAVTSETVVVDEAAVTSETVVVDEAAVTDEAVVTDEANEGGSEIVRVVSDTTETVQAGDATSEAGAATETEATSEAATETGDAKDSEAKRVISETSMAITSQNDYIKKIMEKTTHIQAERLAEIMVEKGEANDIIFLDVRPRSEFATVEGVPGVELNIPRNFLEVEAYEKLPDLDAPIIIISSKGIRGGLAAHTLTDMGYTDVRNLLGGLEAWNKMTAE